MKITKTLKISMVGMGIALNIVGAFIALNLRLPIYLDSIGTILISFLLGPTFGIVTGLLGSIVSGITFDIYSLWFAPVQIFTGFLFGFMYKNNYLKGKKLFFSVLVANIFISFVGAIIAGILFGGFTSSGSSYIVLLLRKLGLGTIASAFIVQFITDYLDKLLATILDKKIVYILSKKYNNSERMF